MKAADENLIWQSLTFVQGKCGRNISICFLRALRLDRHVSPRIGEQNAILENSLRSRIPVGVSGRFLATKQLHNPVEKV